jgi:hypothetical protein
MAHEYFEELMPAMVASGAEATAAAAAEVAAGQQQGDAPMECEGER